MLGSRIAELRSRFGWSQAELARRLNISPSTVGMYEQGRREPSAEMLVAISRVLGVTTEFLLTGERIPGKDSLVLGEMLEPMMYKADPMRLFSREEMLVLLTAKLFGQSRQAE